MANLFFPGAVCLGSSLGLTHSGTAAFRYEHYKRVYTNCTLILGNLEITFLNDEDQYDLSFLSTIQEVRRRACSETAVVGTVWVGN